MIIALHHMFLHCSWQLMLRLSFWWGASTPPFISKRGWGYKEGNWVGYNMILIRTLSLLTYFTYIFIDIIIYVLGSTLWSSEIFWIVGRIIANPSSDLPSPCGTVPRVSILITMLRAFYMMNRFALSLTVGPFQFNLLFSWNNYLPY
jgi:hypothetical protein